MNKVCPDRQLLSVYFDGELPSPWKEKMESHIAACPHCARQLQIYRKIALSSDSAEDPTLSSAQERVWQKLEQGATEESSSPPYRSRVFPGNRAVWRRKISIPIPAAAAAVVLMGLLAFFMGIRVTDTTGNPGMGMTFASEAEFDMPGLVSASDMDMENMMRFFDSRDTGDTIVLRLPEIPGFESYGEPAILSAADYSRQMPGWRK